MKNSLLEILSCVIISWSGKHLDWLESLLGTTDGQALVRGILSSFFLATFFQILSSYFFLNSKNLKNYLHSLCLDSCQLFFTFSQATQKHWSLLLQFSSFFFFGKRNQIWKSWINKQPLPRARRPSECLFGGSGRRQRKKRKTKVGKEEGSKDCARPWLLESLPPIMNWFRMIF